MNCSICNIRTTNLLGIFVLIVSLVAAEETNYTKSCRLRETLISRSTWNQWSGFMCYDYTPSPKSRLKWKYVAEEIKYIDGTIPVTHVTKISGDATYFWYDCLNETSLDYVSRSFISDVFFEKWRTCCLDAIDCCDYFMTTENVMPNSEYVCPAIWDAYSCFGPAKANTAQNIRCPPITYSSKSACVLKSEKRCLSNGNWNQSTDYSTCAIARVLRSRHKFHVIVLIVATIFCFPSVVIFFGFRTFRKRLMFILHRNLIFIIVVRNVLTIIVKETIILESLSTSTATTVMEINGVGCRILAFFENAAKNGMYACMLADGFQLHKAVTRPFADDLPGAYLHIVTLVLLLLPALIWALLRGLHHGTDCWMVDTTWDYWIPDSFRIAILVVNFVLLIDIIRVTILKLREGGISHQARITVRATFILIPLFGIHIVITLNRDIVANDSCAAEDLYYYFSYSLEVLQGIMVSLLFCYFNSEVQHEILNGLRKVTINCRVMGYANKSRRATTATYVESQG